MSIRKHYLDTHRTGLPVQIAAALYSQAAVNEGERVEMVGEHAVSVFGDAEPEEIEQFAADIDRRMPELDRQVEASRRAA